MVKKMLNPIVAVSIVMILYIIMLIMTVIISQFITTYAYMLMCVVLFCFIMLAGGIKRLSATFFLIAPIGLYLLCTFFTNTEPLVIMGYQSLLTLLSVAVGYYYIYYRDETVPVLTKIIIIALTITAITTIIGLIRFPESSRLLATIGTSDNYFNILFSWNNIGGYGFVYTCVLLYPVLILAYKQHAIGRFTFLFMFLVFVTLIILAEYTIALLLMLISSVLYFAGKRTNAAQLLIIGLVVSAIVFLFQSVFENFLLWLSDTLGSEVLSERLTALAGGVSGLEGSESNRLYLYGVSLSAFIKSPVFGNMFEGVYIGGGHSFIFDSLANYGIVGGLALVVAYRNIFRMFFAPFRNEQGYGFVLWSFVQTIILSTVNTEPWFNVTALFMPILFTSIYKRYGSENEDEIEDYLDR